MLKLLFILLLGEPPMPSTVPDQIHIALNSNNSITVTWCTNSNTKTTLKLSSSAGPSIAVNGKTSVYNLTGVDAYTRYMHRVALPPLVSGML